MIPSSKKLVLHLLHATGMLRLLVKMQQYQITILMLHGVTDPEAPSEWKPLRPHLTTSQLENTLSILANYYRFISLDEASDILTGRRPHVPNALVLTFDDGYRNNLTHAMPILRRFDAPATIFLSTCNVTEQQPFWFDRLDYAIQSIEDSNFLIQDYPALRMLDFTSRNSMKYSFLSFIRNEKKRHASNTALRSSILTLTERIEQHSGHSLLDVFENDPWSKVMTCEEVAHAPNDVSFGSHGVDHPILGLTSPEESLHQLRTSRDTIESITSKQCRHLAYPNGSYNNTILSMVKKCNYVSAVTTRTGRNKKGENMLTLKRIAFPSASSLPGNIAAVSGITSIWHKR